MVKPCTRAEFSNSLNRFRRKRIFTRLQRLSRGPRAAIFLGAARARVLLMPMPTTARPGSGLASVVLSLPPALLRPVDRPEPGAACGAIFG